MKKIYFLLLSISGLCSTAFSQSVLECAVQVTASVQTVPPTITLNWPTNGTTNQYTLYRKPKTATLWGAPVTTLSGTSTQYVDNTVSAGVSYEYKITRTGGNYTGYGFINAGIEIPAIENRGHLILVVDSTFISSLAPELKRLEDDLEGDGWNVKRINVLRTGKVTNVKAKIAAVYNQDPANTKALFIFGHVPVPYSGNLNPDGHPDHQGAWPTDDYYADMDGSWTDFSVTSTTLSPARTQNVPGDGKYDQSVLNSALELQPGRVDLFNMTAFAATELQLMKNYLDKDHDYRKKVFSVQKKAVVQDNFGYMAGEVFATSGYNNFAPLVGTANITTGNYFSTMTGTVNSYLWSYGCGGGSFTSASGIGTTTDYANANLQGIFTMLFGSYFGDWDVQNSFLKAPLAQGKMLTSSWSGRPHHQYHHMALGENIGYDMMFTINNQNALYYPNINGISGAWIHNGLMGDPSLRNDVISPVSNVVATKVGLNCNISWSATPEPGILGYNIYMKNDTNKTYVKINPSLIAGTTYTDNCLVYKGIYKYMVRAVKLENTPSGTYYNMSEGIADTANNTVNQAAYAAFTPAINNNTVTFNNNSVNSTAYTWTLNPGVTSTSVSPVNVYTANCTYSAMLVASNQCHSDTMIQSFAINSSVTAVSASFSMSMNSGTVTFTNLSANATNYNWTLDVGVSSNSVNPVYTYTSYGTYTVTLVAYNECETNVYSTTIDLVVGINEWSAAENLFELYPNPAGSELNIKQNGCENCTLTILNSEGKEVYRKTNLQSADKTDLNALAPGLYLVKITDPDNRIKTRKLVKD